MKNPLIKRLPREFTGELAKYLLKYIFYQNKGGLYFV